MHEYAQAATAAGNAIEAAANEGISPAGMTDVNKPAFWTVSEKNWMWGIIVNETDEIVSSGIVNWPSHMGSLNFDMQTSPVVFKLVNHYITRYQIPMFEKAGGSEEI